MTRAEQRGLRLLSGFAGLLALVFCAWLAQQIIIKELRRRKADAVPMVGTNQVPSTDTAHLPELPALDEGWGRVVVGSPSGAAPRLRPIPEATPTAQDEPTPSVERPAPETVTETAPPPRFPADLELVVRPGQSLSKIAAAEYGRSTPELVTALAAYNGMDDPNKLRAGQTLRIPVKAKLLGE